MNNQAPSYDMFLIYQPNAGIDADSFDALLPNAEAWVDEYIFPNSVSAISKEETIAAYQQAICAIIKVDSDYPEGVSKSYTSGKVREEFADSSIPTHENIASQYLSGSGLLCRWL